MNIPRNHIAFRDTSPADHGHVVRTVLIDGREVLVAEDGITITHGPDEPTMVTLRLIPHRVSFD